MRAVRRELRDYDTDDRAPVYMVRVWLPPRLPMQAWAADDWELLETPSIVDVLQWAASQHADGFMTEVFVRSMSGGSWIRIDGTEPDDTGKTIQIPLVT